MSRRKPKPLTEASKAKFDFAIFFAVWANQVQWKVPKLHLDVIKFLDSNDSWDNNTGVLQVFRGAGKSTILGLFITYMLVKNPALRFLILSADWNTAVRITKDVTNIISRHPLAQHLRGKENTWRENTFYVSGNEDPRNPSVTAIGITSNITGGRADFVIFDDVEVPKNAQNEKLREQLRMRIGDTVHILVPGGRRLFVGTPHSFESVYPEMIDKGASALRIPLINNPTGDFPNITGDSVWPERFTAEEIAKRQLDSRSKGNFLSQYQLIPYNSEETTFDVMQLIEYKNEINYYSANSETVLMLGNERMVSCSCFWDPSIGSKVSDDSVLALVFATQNGHYYIHRAWQLTGEAEDQCKQIREYVSEYHVPQVIVETNGVGGFLPPLLRKHLAGTGTSVDGKATTKNKAMKIVEAYEVPLSAGYLHAHSSVLQGKFLTQLRDFNPVIIGKSKDDFIDAVAAAILNEPIRITRGTYYSDTQPRWTNAGGCIEIERDTIDF